MVKHRNAAQRTRAGSLREGKRAEHYRRHQARDAKGRFVKVKPPLLPPELIKRLGAQLVPCTSYDNILETLRPPRPAIWNDEV